MWARRLTLVLAVIAVLLLVALGIRGLLAETVISPLLYLIWGMIRIFQSLPQTFVWMIVVLALAVVALTNLWSAGKEARPRAARVVPHGRVANWLRLIALAESHEYSRWRMAQRLSLLLAETIAEREGIELRIARQRLAEGEIDAPPPVAAFLRAGLDGYRQPAGMFLWRKRQPVFDVALDEVVTAVERLLGVHDQGLGVRG